MDIIFPCAIVGGMGLFFGIILALASKIFAVKEDERIPMIVEALPGANCGGCGYAGCSGYAGAIVKGEAKCNLCAPGGSKSAERIAEIMGVSAEKVDKKVAFVACSGATDVAETRYIYQGLNDCNYANRLGGGPKSCKYACLGLGTCVKACPTGAISVKDGLAVVDKEKCIGCGVCVKECPKNVIKLVDYSAETLVKCHSLDKGKKVKENCSKGCIGCGICAKNCPEEAITMENNLAVIDTEKCKNCGLCVEKCPQKTISVI